MLRRSITFTPYKKKSRKKFVSRNTAIIYFSLNYIMSIIRLRKQWAENLCFLKDIAVSKITLLFSSFDIPKRYATQ